MQEAQRELLSHKINILQALAVGASNDTMRSQLLDTWNRLVSLTYGGPVMDTQIMDQNTMIQEYAKIRNLRPTFKINKQDKRGDPNNYGLVISGLKID
jgi:hypothetical protein